MLDNLEEFFPRDRQKDDYKRLLASVFRYVFHLAQFLRETGGRDRAKVSDTAILQEAIEDVWHDYQFRERWHAARKSSLFPGEFRRDRGARLCRRDR